MLKNVARLVSLSALVGLLALVSSNAVTAQEAPGGLVTLTYRMAAQGYPFGRIIMHRRAFEQQGKRIVEERTDTNISYPDNGGTHTSKSKELVWLGPEGLVKYETDFNENGDKTVLKAGWVGDSLLVRGRFQEGDEWSGGEFEKDQFDFTTPETPPLKGGTKAGDTVMLKWLNFYEMAIAQVKVEYKGKECVKVDGRTFDCSIIVYDNPAMGLGGKIWLAKDHVGRFLLKENGHSPDGEFTMEVTKYETR